MRDESERNRSDSSLILHPFSAEPEGGGSMQVEARGLIYDATAKPDAERIAFFTSLCPLRSGVILCSFQVGPSKHAPNATLRLCRSRDGGTNWQELPHRFATALDGVPGSLAVGEMVEI